MVGDTIQPMTSINYHMAKGSINKVKRQVTGRNKYFQHLWHTKVFLCRIYTAFRQINKKNENNPIQKKQQRIWIEIHRKGMQNKHIKRFSTAFISFIQSKIMSFFHLSDWHKLKRLIITSLGDDIRNWELLNVNGDTYIGMVLLKEKTIKF